MPAVSVDVLSGIPPNVIEVTCVIKDLSTNGTSPILVQVGAGASTVTSGYTGDSFNSAGTAVSNTAHSTGILINPVVVLASHVISGTLTLTRLPATVWLYKGTIHNTDTPRITVISGQVTVGNELSKLVFTTLNGTDAFDGGYLDMYYTYRGP